MTRPRLHFTPRNGWVNDPYGVTWHDGRYHLFFQHVPGSTRWRLEQHWGHAVSSDLAHWEQLEDALAPGEGDDGVWSGSVAGDRAFYTSVAAATARLGTIRSALPIDDGWTSWSKGDPSIGPHGLDLSDLRDPFVLRDGDRWRMVVGAGTTGGTGLALTWTSGDLDVWTYDGVLASGADAGVWTGSTWECPQLFAVDDRWVLLVSAWADGVTHHEVAAVGDLVDGRFRPERWQRLTYGAPYAGSAFTDREGRPCLIHWLRDVADPEAGWAGAHSVPHVVRIVGGRVVLEPHPAVADAVEGLGPDSARVVGGAGVVVSERQVTVADGARTLVVMPHDGSAVRLLVDGPVLEVFGAHGTAGLGLSVSAHSSSMAPSVRQ